MGNVNWQMSVWCVFFANGYSSYITDETYLGVGQEIYGKLSGKHTQTYFAQMIKGRFFPVKALVEGGYYIDVVFTNLTGDMCKLSDFLNKGKYILLDCGTSIVLCARIKSAFRYFLRLVDSNQYRCRASKGLGERKCWFYLDESE